MLSSQVHTIVYSHKIKTKTEKKIAYFLKQLPAPFPDKAENAPRRKHTEKNTARSIYKQKLKETEVYYTRRRARYTDIAISGMPLSMLIFLAGPLAHIDIYIYIIHREHRLMKIKIGANRG